MPKLREWGKAYGTPSFTSIEEAIVAYPALTKLNWETSYQDWYAINMAYWERFSHLFYEPITSSVKLMKRLSYNQTLKYQQNTRQWARKRGEEYAKIESIVLTLMFEERNAVELQLLNILRERGIILESIDQDSVDEFLMEFDCNAPYTVERNWRKNIKQIAEELINGSGNT